MVCKYAFFGEAPAALGGAKGTHQRNPPRICLSLFLVRLYCSLLTTL